jgi:hypothetical protein
MEAGNGNELPRWEVRSLINSPAQGEAPEMANPLGWGGQLEADDAGHDEPQTGNAPWVG